jgi:hypothetical protein
MRCACDSLVELDGVEAIQYADEHLDKLGVDAVNWTKTYKCPDTGADWLMDYPQSHLQGGGPPRLRLLDNRGLPVERPSVDPYR